MQNCGEPTIYSPNFEYPKMTPGKACKSAVENRIEYVALSTNGRCASRWYYAVTESDPDLPHLVAARVGFVLRRLFWWRVVPGSDGPSIRKRSGGFGVTVYRVNNSGDVKMIARAFRHILEKDQDLHGVKADYSIADSAVEKLQQEVDDVIDANTLNTATSGAAPIAA
ncbi:hypothetical protein B0H14DRAFT_3548600 [Mycena olivaceomarginata]|nr:hypothetical protein B0H14DRAFT_3548600 [Mycena olivaceomarginata]